MAVNFRELTSVKVDDIKAPLPLPEGTYFGVVKSYELGDNNKNKTPYARYSFTLHSAGDDIDPADLEGIELGNRRLTQDFYLTPDAMFRLKEFLVSLGLKTEGLSLDEVMPESVGAEVTLYVIQRPNPEKPEDPPRNNIKSVKGA